jgi:hypothetical protein
MTPRQSTQARSLHPDGSGSIIGFAASDGSLLPVQLQRPAQRVGLGVARLGACSNKRSGELLLASVTSAALSSGHPYGGVVACILQPGDPGYVAGQTHGLIAAVADQTGVDSGIQWATEPYWSTWVPGAPGSEIGTGAANTNAIIAQNGAGSTYAAGLARAYRGGGHSDWFLPSRDELDKLYQNRAAIGGFHTDGDAASRYWSSSWSSGYPWIALCQSFSVGWPDVNGFKENTHRVRAVRAF